MLSPRESQRIPLRQIERRIDRIVTVKGAEYRVTLLGRSRRDGTWEGRIRFEPLAGGGASLVTPVESTQPNERLLLDWAQGLGDAFYEGAFQHAAGATGTDTPLPARAGVPDSTHVDITEVEMRVLESLRANRGQAIDRKLLFERVEGFSNSDIARALDNLERGRQIIRFTDRGFVWIALSKLWSEPAPPERRRARGDMPELIFEHPHPIGKYDVVVLGVERADGTWAGWLQFRDVKTNAKLRTGQETSQPDRRALEYWASGLEDLYLEGALKRAERSSA